MEEVWDLCTLDPFEFPCKVEPFLSFLRLLECVHQGLEVGNGIIIQMIHIMRIMNPLISDPGSIIPVKRGMALRTPHLVAACDTIDGDMAPWAVADRPLNLMTGHDVILVACMMIG